MDEAIIEQREIKISSVKPRRLKAHKSSVTCCIASRFNPGLIFSSDEGGCLCCFDLRCKDSVATIDAGKNKDSVTSLCFKEGIEDVVYASSGNEVKCYDVRMLSSWKLVESYSYNKEEINQITFSPKASFLAAADDSGEIKIIDIGQQCLYKTLRNVHTSICSSVQFLSWKPWEAITGGLDSKLVMWNFSRGNPDKIFDFGASNDFGSTKLCSHPNQCYNPAFVHSITVPKDIQIGLEKICAVARGDGTVSIIDIESELIDLKKKATKPNKHSKFKSKDSKTSMAHESGHKTWLNLDYAVGGHTSAVSSVDFSTFGDKGKFLISGGNDASVKVWDWIKPFRVVDSCSNHSPLKLNINLSKKVNWLCTSPTDSDNLIVCDTSKVIKIYTIS